MKNRTLFLGLALAMTLVPSFSYAATPSPWTEKTTSAEKTKGKLDFGFKNFFGGWTEIFTEPREACKAKECVIKGIGRGLWNSVADTVGGVLHIATFPIPLDVPLPEGGVNL